MKRILSIVLAIVMIAALFPLQAFADEVNASAAQEKTEQELTLAEPEAGEQTEKIEETEAETAAAADAASADAESGIAVVAESQTSGTLSDLFEYVLYSDGSATIKKYKGSDTQVQVPETIDGCVGCARRLVACKI